MRLQHPLKIEDVLETQRAEKRREAAEQARAAILAEQEAAKPKKKGKKAGSSVKNALGVDLAALREAPSVSTTRRMRLMYRSPRRRAAGPLREAGLAPAASYCARRAEEGMVCCWVASRRWSRSTSAKRSWRTRGRRGHLGLPAVVRGTGRRGAGARRRRGRGGDGGRRIAHCFAASTT